MKLIFEDDSPEKIKYKNNIRLETDNAVVRINKDQGRYVVSWYAKDTLRMYKPKVYQSFEGMKDYILRTYNIELVKSN